MPHRFAACLGGGAVSNGPLPSTTARSSLTTSTYATRFGPAALTWSRGALSLTLQADLCISDDNEDSIHFVIQPWLFWKRRGSRRFHLKDSRFVDFAWDLSEAIFAPSGSQRPDPVSGFFVAVLVDREMLLVAGDLVEEAYKKTRARRPNFPFSNPAPDSRREHVVLRDPGGRGLYRTVARSGGENRDISIELNAKEGGREAGMSVSLDGERVLHVRRLRWKFRGSETVEIGGGARMRISWNLHDWLFQSKDHGAARGRAAARAAELARARARALFVFRFEEEEQEVSNLSACNFGDHSANGVHKDIAYRGNFRKMIWNEGSCSKDGGGMILARRWSLLKTSSCSSSRSTTSSLSSSSTVMEWESHEDLELRRPEGFSLLVYISKSSFGVHSC